MNLPVNTILAIARLCLTEARRTRFFWVVLVAAAGLYALAAFLGTLAITESSAVRAGSLAALARLLAAVLLAMFVVNAMVREFRDKGAELALSLPIHRGAYFLGKLLGFSAVAVLVALLLGALALLVAPLDQALFWITALALELCIVAAIALLAAITFSQPTAALALTGGVYVLARLIVFFQLMGHGPLVPIDSPSQWVFVTMVDALAFILPDLSQFAASEWLIHGGAGWGQLAGLAVQTAIYVPLLSAIAMFDLWRRNF